MKYLTFVIVIVTILATNPAMAAPTDPGRWIDDLFATGIQVEYTEDGFGTATEPEAGTILEFCVREMACDTAISEVHWPLAASAQENWVSDMFTETLTVVVYEDGSGLATGYEDIVVEFCVQGMLCDAEAYTYRTYMPFVPK